MWPIAEQHDQMRCLFRHQVENLPRKLKKAVDCIDAGIEHHAIIFVDYCLI